jgi:hypothetical protein
MRAVVGYESITLLTQLTRSLGVVIPETSENLIASKEMKDAMVGTNGGKESGVVSGTASQRALTEFQSEIY